MFGMANQMLSVIALAVATTVLFNAGKGRYAAATLVPMAFVAATTTAAGYGEITGKYWGWTRAPETALKGYLNIGLTAMLMACVAVIVAASARRWVAGRKPEPVEELAAGA